MDDRAYAEARCPDCQLKFNVEGLIDWQQPNPVKEEREFACVWMHATYDPKATTEGRFFFNEDHGYSIDDIKRIEALPVGGIYGAGTDHLVIRVK